jgi:hypothetical protein
VKIHFHENFDKDLSKVGDAILAKQIRKLILRLENVRNLAEIQNVKKMQGGPSSTPPRMVRPNLTHP